MPEKNALIIFAKKPTPGTVKTRLTPPLRPEEAAHLYHCMLLDTLERTSQLTGIDRLLFYENSPGASRFFVDNGVDFPLFPQEGHSLGERMEKAFRQTFALGYKTVAIIGSDSPDLPLPFIREAFDTLVDKGVDAVLGPSDDGGYYLLAMSRLHRELFQQIPWSTDKVAEKTMTQAGLSGIRMKLLEVWYDVDTIDDLDRPEIVVKGNGAPLTREYVLSWKAQRKTDIGRSGSVT